MEAAAAVENRNGAVSHRGLENAPRFPQLPQPASPESLNGNQRLYSARHANGTPGGNASEQQGSHGAENRHRSTGKATNIVINANESGTIRFTERFVCVEWNDEFPVRGQVAINFAGPRGTVSQLAGVGNLTIIN